MQDDEFIREAQSFFGIFDWLCAEKVLIDAVIDDGGLNTVKPLDTAGIKSIEVELADGRKLPTRYGGHPPRQPTDFFWTAAWMIPEGFPTGTLGYKVTATDIHGNSQTWEPMREYRSWVVIIPGTVEYVRQPPQ